ncbi:MAG: hypothetical protein CO096_08665, partial [Armatimonadetes bacterium CG_4_9_14_3_um_filter_66_14]
MPIAVLLLCLAPSISWAQTSAPLTVEHAVALAVEHHPLLQAATYEVAAAQAGVLSARALTNPDILFTPGITSPSGSDEELLVQQPLEVNGVRSARTGAARARLRHAQAQAVGELRDLVFETKAAYFDLTRARESRSLAQDVLGTTEELDRGVRRQVEEGLKAGVDQLQTGVEMSRA